jgi:hypothetical protein
MTANRDAKMFSTEPVSVGGCGARPWSRACQSSASRVRSVVYRPLNVKPRKIEPVTSATGARSKRAASSWNLAVTSAGVRPRPYSGCAAANFAKSGKRSSIPRAKARIAVMS